MSAQAKTITKHSAGSLRELISIQYPLLLSLISGSLMGFCDRIFLARYSLEAFEAVSYAIYICMIFQLGCMRIVSASQVLISRSIGSGQEERAGLYTWQVVWFSIASLLVTYPLSKAVSYYFFNVGQVGELGQIYFGWMMACNFLFPLGTALSSFFTGIGKTRTITYVTIFAHTINITLNYPLIFGIKGLIPSLGIAGAAIATGISQGVYCALLIYFLMQERYLSLGGRRFRLKLGALREVLALGTPTAAARMHNLFVWSLMVKMVVEKGAEYSLALSFGSTLAFLFAPLNDSGAQALITVFSYYFGRGQDYISKLVLKKAHFLVLIHLFVVSFLVICFQKTFIAMLVKEEISTAILGILKSNTIWYCFFFLMEALALISFAWVMANKESKLIMLSNIVYTWTISYSLFFLAFKVLSIPAKYTWLVVAANLLAAAPTYYLSLQLKQKFRPSLRQRDAHT